MRCLYLSVVSTVYLKSWTPVRSLFCATFYWNISLSARPHSCQQCQIFTNCLVCPDIKHQARSRGFQLDLHSGCNLLHCVWISAKHFLYLQKFVDARSNCGLLLWWSFILSRVRRKFVIFTSTAGCRSSWFGIGFANCHSLLGQNLLCTEHDHHSCFLAFILSVISETHISPLCRGDYSFRPSMNSDIILSPFISLPPIDIVFLGWPLVCMYMHVSHKL